MGLILTIFLAVILTLVKAVGFITSILLLVYVILCMNGLRMKIYIKFYRD